MNRKMKKQKKTEERTEERKNGRTKRKHAQQLRTRRRNTKVEREGQYANKAEMFISLGRIWKRAFLNLAK